MDHNPDRLCVWPGYFDMKQSRRSGRRVPKDASVLKPDLEGLFMARAPLACAKSSAKRTSPTHAVHTDGRAACGFPPRAPRNPSVREAKRRCSNSLAVNGAKCNAINAKRPSSNPLVGLKRVTGVLVLSAKTHNSAAVSRSERASRTVEFKTEIDNL